MLLFFRMLLFYTAASGALLCLSTALCHCPQNTSCLVMINTIKHVCGFTSVQHSVLTSTDMRSHNALVHKITHQTLTQLVHVCNQGSAAGDAYNKDAIDSFVEQLTDFDRRMNTAVVESGILRGISQGQLATTGMPLELYCCDSGCTYPCCAHAF